MFSLFTVRLLGRTNRTPLDGPREPAIAGHRHATVAQKVRHSQKTLASVLTIKQSFRSTTNHCSSRRGTSRSDARMTLVFVTSPVVHDREYSAYFQRVR